MNHSLCFVCADVLILNDEYVIDFIYVCMWRPAGGGSRHAYIYTRLFACVAGIYVFFFCLSAWLSRNSSIIATDCFFSRCFFLLSWSVDLLNTSDEEISRWLYLFYEHETRQINESKKVNALKLSKKNISSQQKRKNVNLIYTNANMSHWLKTEVYSAGVSIIICRLSLLFISGSR